MSPSRATLTLEEAARRAGRYRWLEMRLFETLGGWVPEVAEVDVKLQMAVHASHHAWHAELWRELLPGAAGVDGGEATAAAGEGVLAFVAALAEARGPHLTVEKLVGVYRVLLPRMVAAYTGDLRAASPVSDGPAIRCLRLILRDELEDWADGELLVQSLLADGGAARRAADRQGHLEGLLIAAGGLLGSGGSGSPAAPRGPAATG